jgi:hypothetical protein
MISSSRLIGAASGYYRNRARDSPTRTPAVRVQSLNMNNKQYCPSASAASSSSSSSSPCFSSLQLQLGTKESKVIGYTRHISYSQDLMYALVMHRQLTSSILPPESRLGRASTTTTTALPSISSLLWPSCSCSCPLLVPSGTFFFFFSPRLPTGEKQPESVSQKAP